MEYLLWQVLYQWQRGLPEPPSPRYVLALHGLDEPEGAFYFNDQDKRCILQNSEVPDSGGVKRTWLEVLCTW